MLKVLLVLVSVLSGSLVVECRANSLAEQWAKVTKPSAYNGSAQSIGSYTAGCISGAVSLPMNGSGFQMMRLSRKRSFGHPDLKQFIEHLGQTATHQHLGVLLIGDLGQPRGGPTINGHRSHQTGLDVDIWFLLSKQAENHILTISDREAWGAPSVLVGATDTLDHRQWSVNNEKVLEAAAGIPEVDRIFVNPSIKRELCNRYAGHQWLQKIRPWWKHDDHFHVRLKCPKNSIACQAQEPLPLGDGCDAGLDWWFSEEAKHPSPSITPPAELKLPLLCESVLKE